MYTRNMFFENLIKNDCILKNLLRRCWSNDILKINDINNREVSYERTLSEA